MEGYEKLGYVALNVSDVAKSRAFYEQQVGLQFSGEGEGGITFLRCSEDHHSVALYCSEKPGLKRVGFEMRSEAALDILSQRLANYGTTVTEVSATERKILRLGRALRITEPFSGATFEFYVTMGQFAGQPFAPTVAKIQRLGHVVLRIPDFDDACSFYTNVLGFRVSDVIDGAVCFMRCHPNPYHHGVGLGKSNEAMLHHVNFMVTEIDDIGRGISRFNKSGVPIVNGPGRHPPSGSMFLYFLDPDGITVEYSFGMEEFPAEGARKPRIMEPVRASIDYWDSFLDPRKGTVGAIERLVPTASAAEKARLAAE
jgi:2,3-dihydroxy-p-cumate/2,3-dihydroxybenzoate 3,4-dioxygenase